LGYLKEFPVDTLKVDRSFVEALPHDLQAAALVRGVIALAKSMRLTVVGEGIKTDGQLLSLKEAGCDFGQGYLHGRPLPAAAAREFLHAQKHPITPVEDGESHVQEPDFLPS
jgi:EAL domain-containing protein (putative c-di-GMP-specific phosphodiesterase class I)